MDKLTISVILLFALIGAFVFFSVPQRTGISSLPTGKPAKTVSVDLKALARAADGYVDRGFFQEALNTLSPAKVSDDPEIQAILGYAYSGLQNFRAAADAFDRAIKKNRDLRWVYALACLHENMGEAEKAKPLFAELSKATLPQSVSAKVCLGLARTNAWSGDSEGAVAAYRKAIKIDPKLEEAFVGAFKVLKNTSKVKELKEAAAIGDPYHSGRFDYNFWKGFALQEMGEDAAALEAFKNCMILNPENSSSYYFSYKILRKSRKIEEALGELQKFLSVNQGLPYIFFQAALEAKEENRLDLAFSFLRASILVDRTLLGRNDNDTIGAVRKHIEKNGTPEEKSFMKVFNSFINGEIKSSQEEMLVLLPSLKSEQLKKDGETLVKECGIILSRESAFSDYQKALQQQKAQAKAVIPKPAPAAKPEKETPADSLKRLALSNPRDVKLQYSTALKLAELGDLEGAKAFLRETIRANPTVSEAYYSLACISIRQRNSQEAVEHLEQAIKNRPGNSQARSLLAAIRLEAGEVDRAIDGARAALAANPANPEARFVLAEAFNRKQNPEKALEQIEYGLEIENDPVRREKLLALKTQLSPH